MIVIGVLMLIFGVFLYMNGNATNNDLDAQMESIFNDGVANPGSEMESIGGFLAVIGIVLLIIGVIVKVNKKDDTAPSNEKTNSEGDMGKRHKANSVVCPKCGAMVIAAHTCANCGEPLPQKKKIVPCSHCGAACAEGSKFCLECGKSLIQKEEKTICSNCGEEVPEISQFCLHCGKSFSESN